MRGETMEGKVRLLELERVEVEIGRHAGRLVGHEPEMAHDSEEARLGD